MKLSRLRAVAILGMVLTPWACSPSVVPAPRAAVPDVPVDFREDPESAGRAADLEACHQNRNTPAAPASLRDRINPLPAGEDTREAGRRLYQKEAKPLACKLCHGERGDGRGDPDFESAPPARNFTCAPVMNALPDGQLFWIIRNGSPDTAMPAYPHLSEDDIWKLIHYIRHVDNQ